MYCKNYEIILDQPFFLSFQYDTDTDLGESYYFAQQGPLVKRRSCTGKTENIFRVRIPVRLGKEKSWKEIAGEDFPVIS